ncbi:MAG: sigma-70 family RNA polymerase sigma factor [Oscillospiraceae bacterium]
MSNLLIALTDEELCDMVASGNQLAEETLVVRYQRLVRASARPFFLAGGDSEDLLQEGMLGLLSAIRSFTPDREAGFRTYAEVCVRNRLLSAIKSAVCSKHLPLNHCISLETPIFDGTTDYGFHSSNNRQQQNPEDVIVDREALQERMKALSDELSGFESKVLSHYLDGLSYGEIAQATSRSPKSVDNAIQRIRRKLDGN